MNGTASITLTWGDGEHTFRLRIGELRELQEKCGAGIGAIWDRVQAGHWYVDDLREILRLGLIGGGMSSPLALGLVAKYAGDGAIFAASVTARYVLMVALFGNPDDIVGKVKAETAPTEAAPSTETAASGSRPSSETAQQWDGRRETSTPAPFGSSPRPLTDGDGRMVPRDPGLME